MLVCCWCLFCAGEASSSGQAAGQQGASSSSAAGTSKQAPQQQQSKSLGVNEEGLPMVRGVVCCPFFMGTGKCAFKSGCKYHHPMHAMHPVCLLQGAEEGGARPAVLEGRVRAEPAG